MTSAAEGPAGAPPAATEAEPAGAGPVTEAEPAGAGPVTEAEPAGEGPVAEAEPGVAPEEAPEETDGGHHPGDFRMALVASVTVDLPVQHPVVLLREVEAPRRHLSFPVGFPEGVALAHGLRRVPTPRPAAHELLSDVLSGFDIDLVAVRLVGRQGRTYFAELDLRSPRGRRVYSCRPSDALAVALCRPVPVPILVDARLFDVDGDVVPA